MNDNIQGIQSLIKQVYFNNDFNTLLNNVEIKQYRNNSTKATISDKTINEISITDKGWNVDVFLHKPCCVVAVMDKSVNRNDLGKCTINNVVDSTLSHQLNKIINDNKLFNFFGVSHKNDYNNLSIDFNNETFIEYNDEYIVIAIRTNQYYYIDYVLIYDKQMNCKIYQFVYYNQDFKNNYFYFYMKGSNTSDYDLSIMYNNNNNSNTYFYYYYYTLNSENLKNIKFEKTREFDKERDTIYINGKPKKVNPPNKKNYLELELTVNNTDQNAYTFYKVFNEGNPDKKFDVINQTTNTKYLTTFGIQDIQLDNNYRYYVNGKYINQDMRLGHITGNVNVQECFDENDEPIKTKFKVRVERDDRTHIGDYDVINGFYEIPQLDVNSRYNLFLYDELNNMEWQVLSNRKPKPIGNDVESKETQVTHKVIYSKNNNGYFVRVDKKYSYQDKVFYRNISINNISHTIVGKHSIVDNNFNIQHIEIINFGNKLVSNELTVENIKSVNLRIE